MPQAPAMAAPACRSCSPTVGYDELVTAWSDPAEGVSCSVACTGNVLECSRSNCRGKRMSGRIPIAAINPGWPALACSLCVCLLVLAAILPGLASGEPRGEPKRVLILHSFGRDFRPWGNYARAIREELDQLSPWQLDIQDHSLIAARSSDENPEPAFVAYLNALNSGRAPD